MPSLSHGMSRTPIYNQWRAMRDRCNNPSNHAYARYGGRGIKVCDEWNKSFESFFKHVGHRPEGKSLDRIHNDGNYEPGNVRWATDSQQMHNRSKFYNREYKGVSKRDNGKYRSRIMFNRISINIGTYDTKEEAAYMYDCFSVALFGEDTPKNFL